MGLALWILLSALWLWLLGLCTSAAAILLFRAGLRRARGDQQWRKVSKSRLADLGVVRGRTDPWPTALSGASVLNAVSATFRRYVVLFE